LRIVVRVGLLLFGALAGPVSPAAADPVDLTDRRARPVRLALEISPPHLPAQLDRIYGDRVPAWLEPGPGAGEVSIRVAGPEVERLLDGFDPVPGSFGDFVWIFDAGTGHVLTSTLRGTIRQRLDWGFFETLVRAKIEARMTTLRPAGLRPPRSLLGRILFDHCGGPDRDCILVPSRPYDAYTGYVNAVGSISARAAGGLSSQTFSPLGEAVFTEMPSDTAVSAR
jgi:hypothetical protein